MKRRSFIQTSSAMSLPFVVGGTKYVAVGKNKLFDLVGDDNDKIIVLVQLLGGNDGLSAVIPLDQYDNLVQVRSNVLVPESSIIKLTDEVGFHPQMTGMSQMWDEDQLGVLQGVAYPNQNRSHFRSTDIWNSASAADEFISTGWIGRYYDLNHASYPNGYPNAEQEDPFALSIGTIISETCQGSVSNFSLALTDPFNPGAVNIGEEGDVPDNCYGRELTFIKDIAKQTNAYSDTILAAANAGNNLSSKYGDDNALAQKLKNVARLISGGLGTKIYVVQLGGFDLHSNQAEIGDTTVGRQANLMRTLSDAICAFQDDCVRLGIDDRVMGMTFSEFGRRIRSNQSNGTDHGTAAPLFVFGSCVNSNILGENAEINPDADINEGVPMQFDFRSVYASMLMDWFGVSDGDIREVLYDDFQHLPIVECELVATDDPIEESITLKAFPNPFDNYFTVVFNSENKNYRISLYDSIGSELKIISNQKFAQGRHEIKVPTHELIPGIYFIRVADEQKQKTVRLVKS